MKESESPDPTVREPTVRLRADASSEPDDGVVSAADDSAGGIDFDDLGRARWKWVTEGESGADIDDTFDYLKALDHTGLEIADEAEAEAGERPAAGQGYNPYDTVVLPAPPKLRRR